MTLHFRVLLFLPVSILVGTFCVFAFPATGHPTYTWAIWGVVSTHDKLALRLSIAESENIAIAPETIDSWLLGILPESHPATRFLLDVPKTDIWGNPYRLRIEPNPASDDLLVYSTGRDGISNSNGNDPNDIRYWDEKKGGWYARRHFFRTLFTAALFGSLLSPIILMPLLWITKQSKTLRNGRV